MKPIVSLSIPQCWKPTFGTASWDVSCTVFHPRICDARHTKCQQAIFVLSLFCRCILAPNRLTNLRRRRTVRAPKCCKFSGKREVQTQKCCKYRWNGSLQVQNAANSKENEQNSTLRKIHRKKSSIPDPFVLSIYDIAWIKNSHPILLLFGVLWRTLFLWLHPQMVDLMKQEATFTVGLMNHHQPWLFPVKGGVFEAVGIHIPPMWSQGAIRVWW